MNIGVALTEERPVCALAGETFGVTPTVKPANPIRRKSLRPGLLKASPSFDILKTNSLSLDLLLKVISG